MAWNRRKHKSKGSEKQRRGDEVINGIDWITEQQYTCVKMPCETQWKFLKYVITNHLHCGFHCYEKERSKSLKLQNNFVRLWCFRLFSLTVGPRLWLSH